MNMIRKVPNMKAWILRGKDYHTFIETVCLKNWIILLKLPLFNTRILKQNVYGHYYEVSDDEYYCIIEEPELCKIFSDGYNLTLDEVESINKTWNEFYNH